MRKRTPIAIAIGDIHLSSRPPRFRSGESDWFSAMERIIEQLRNTVDEYSVPVFCAGDVFDRWNATPELINWAIEMLPTMYAVPGQHDLPQHSFSDIHRSAFDTLVRAGTIQPIAFRSTGGSAILRTPNEVEYCLYGFPWGADVKKNNNWDGLSIAVVHQYMWIPSAKYPTAPKESRVSKRRKDLAAFDVVIVGDNHIPFEYEIGNTVVWNCGTFFRRHSPDANHEPRMGLIHDDGSIDAIPFDTSDDVYSAAVDIETPTAEEMNLTDFIDSLESLERSPMDFRANVLRYIKEHENDISPQTKKTLLEAMGQ